MGIHYEQRNQNHLLHKYFKEMVIIASITDGIRESRQWRHLKVHVLHMFIKLYGGY